jgi:hypothetical protein
VLEESLARCCSLWRNQNHAKRTADSQRELRGTQVPSGCHLLIQEMWWGRGAMRTRFLLHRHRFVDPHVHRAVVQQRHRLLDRLGLDERVAEARGHVGGEFGYGAVLGDVATVEQGVAGIYDVVLDRGPPLLWASWNSGVGSISPWARNTNFFTMPPRGRWLGLC